MLQENLQHYNVKYENQMFSSQQAKMIFFFFFKFLFYLIISVFKD